MIRRRLWTVPACRTGGDRGLWTHLCFLMSVFSLFLTTAGCGYTTRSMMSPELKTIRIEQFVNKIDVAQQTYVSSAHSVYRPGLETDITKAVIGRFLFDRNLKVASGQDADLILKGELVEFRRDPVRYDDSSNVAEYRINIVVNLILWSTEKDKLVWEEKRFTGDTTYFTSGSQAKPEASAVNDALNDLSRRIVERTVEQW